MRGNAQVNDTEWMKKKKKKKTEDQSAATSIPVCLSLDPSGSTWENLYLYLYSSHSQCQRATGAKERSFAQSSPNLLQPLYSTALIRFDKRGCCDGRERRESTSITEAEEVEVTGRQSLQLISSFVSWMDTTHNTALNRYREWPQGKGTLQTQFQEKGSEAIHRRWPLQQQQHCLRENLWCHHTIRRKFPVTAEKQER